MIKVLRVIHRTKMIDSNKKMFNDCHLDNYPRNNEVSYLDIIDIFTNKKVTKTKPRELKFSYFLVDPVNFKLL